MLTVLASIAASGAGLLFLASLLMSGVFAGRVPAGADAMGLVVPLFASAAAALLLLLATWLVAASGRLAWLGAHAGWIATAVALAVGVAGIGVLIAWMERMGSWVPMIGWFCGGVAPLLAVGLLLRCAWHTPAQLQAATWPKLLAAPLLVSVLCALVLLFVGGARQLRRDAALAEQARVQQVAEQAERDRREALSPLARLHEDYASMSAQTPLWVFIASLPDTQDAELRAAMITRALQVPDLDAALAATLTDDHPRYRHGALLLLCEAPDAVLKPAWAALLAQSIAVSADQIQSNPHWLHVDDFANPDPIAHIAAMRKATSRFDKDDVVAEALTQLRTRLSALPASPERVGALAALADE